MNSRATILKPVTCFCGAEVPDIEGPVHPYMESTPGCWKAYGEILAREYSDIKYMRFHQVTVDSFACQHYGKPSPQNIQSVNLHLASLHLVFAKGKDLLYANQAIQKLAKFKTKFTWLAPPVSVGHINLMNIWKAKNAKDHTDQVYEWGKSTWRAWASHHKTIEKILTRIN
jgi:Family of unknown function (DUF5946)